LRWGGQPLEVWRLIALSKGSSIIIWDEEGRISTEKIVVYWQSYQSNMKDIDISIPALVEKNSKKIKSEYLSLIFEIGEVAINKVKIIDYYEISPGFSYWWMTLLSEKCNYAKSPEINNAIKLIALKNWLISKNVITITLVTSNKKLTHAIKLLAKHLKIEFKFTRPKSKKVIKFNVEHVYRIIPNFIKSFVWLTRQLILRQPLIGVGVEEWKKSKHKITFVSYLANLTSKSFESGVYDSNYWTKLIPTMQEKGIQTNWLHIYVKDQTIKSESQAKDVINAFNSNHKGDQVHTTLDSFINFEVVYSTILGWFRLLKMYKLSRSQIKLKCSYFWPLLSDDLSKTMSGAHAMNNLLNFYLFNRSMNLLSHQDKGFYLCEGQGWEYGFIHSWNNNGHKKHLTGIMHTTILYWHLRFFFDSRIFFDLYNCNIPLPKKFGINGDAAEKMLISEGYPENKIIKLEALRYLHLKYLNIKNVQNHHFYYKSKILVLCDYIDSNVESQLNLLQEFKTNNNFIEFIIKPHPATPINLEKYSQIDKSMITNRPIFEIIDNCEVVFTGNATSAAAEAYCCNKSVIVMLDPKVMNFSPLRGKHDVAFVSSVEGFSSAIENSRNFLARLKRCEKSFFYIDDKLEKWMKLLK
jgi:surface carbohydrate biosynthesis protein (TIGR04326 family)